MAKRPKPRKPVYQRCLPCGKRFVAGYEGDPILVSGSSDCAAELIRIVEQSETIFVPLPKSQEGGDA